MSCARCCAALRHASMLPRSLPALGLQCLGILATRLRDVLGLLFSFIRSLASTFHNPVSTFAFPRTCLLICPALAPRKRRAATHERARLAPAVCRARLVTITSDNAEDADAAVQWVQDVVGDLEPGAVFDGIVSRVVDFGVFVSFGRRSQREGLVGSPLVGARSALLAGVSTAWLTR